MSALKSANSQDDCVARSIVECFGSDSSRCGYCRRPNSSRTFGVWAHRLDVRDYQNMLDAGWRRSGCYLYRPDLRTTCCPSFVVRLEVSRFKPSLSHKRVLKRLRRYSGTGSQSSVRSSPSRMSSSTLSQSGSIDWMSGDRTTNQSSQNVNTSNTSDSFTTQTRAHLLDIVQNAVTDCFGSNRLVPSLTIPDSTQVASRMKVFPPRQKPSLPQLKQGSASGSQGSIGPMTWCTNAAMILAAAERASRRDETAVSGISGTDRRKRANDIEGAIQRQLAIAHSLLPYIEQKICGAFLVTVSNPGFINFLPVIEPSSAVASIPIPSRIPSRDLSSSPKFSDSVSLVEASVVAKSTGHKRVKVAQAPLSHPHTPGDALDVITDEDPPMSGETRGGRDEKDVVGDDEDGSDGEKMTTSCDEIELDDDVNGDDNDDGESDDDDDDDDDDDLYMDDLDDPILKDPSVGRGSFARINEVMKDGEFSMEVVPPKFRSDSYDLFRKYQTTIHKEPPSRCSRESYLRFLVDSPLVNERVSGSVDVWYGSFHILYKLSGRLFAVGVVDLLPNCLSSVYLFYDPEVSKLSPGTLSALKEIEWVQNVKQWYPSMRYYYMGFYIHSCPKMRYKANFVPSELLCDESKVWVPTTRALPLLNASNGKFVRLAPSDCAPAPEATNFMIDDTEIAILTDESKLQLKLVGNHGEKRWKLLSLRSLSRLLDARGVEQLEAGRKQLEVFIRLVGRNSAMYFIHVL